MGKSTAKRLNADEAGIAQASDLLSAGQLVAVPTETVYGLAGDARNPSAVAAIFHAKGRPQKNPLIVHVANVEAAREIVELSEQGEALAQAFWPGPLTLVAPAKRDSGIAPAVMAGHTTVAVRVPAHSVAKRLLERSGVALAAPSANRSGRVSPTTADHVFDELGESISAIVDAGPCAVGVESTIVGISGGPTLLRPGGLPTSNIEECLGTRLAKIETSDEAPTAPGQLSSHYAPNAQIRMNASKLLPGETLLGFGPVQGAALNLSPSGDLTEAAANLFAFLRELDAEDNDHIAVSPIPESGIGAAINDRLRRAAAPRS